MEPLRIVHVLPSLAVGGQERVALDLARRQLEEGHRVRVIALDPRAGGPVADALGAAGIATLAVPKLGPTIDPSLPLRLAWRLRGADIVHTHGPLALVYGATAGRLAGAAVVHTKHGADPGPLRRAAIRRAAASLVDAYVAVSEATAALARAHRDVSDARLVVVPNGVDLRRFGPDPRARAAVRRELGVPEGAWLVGTVGRLVDVKDQALLVRAASRAGHDLLLVGDGPERAALERLVAKLGAHSRVRFAGERADVPRLLAALDLFALTSRSEGLPLVLPEAMATGLPVVATRVGGVPQVVDDGETGFLVDPGDEPALVARLEDFAADPTRARAFGARARGVALARFSLGRMASAYEALYRSLVASRRAGREVMARSRSSS
jgi:glycosyltransferase involved in cell wall biosynthesis